MLGETMDDRLGKCNLSPRTATAGDTVTLRITYTAGTVTVREGGCVRFEHPFYFPPPFLLDAPNAARSTLRCTNKQVAWIPSQEDVLTRKYKPDTPISQMLRQIHGRSEWFYNIRWGRHLYVTLVRGRMNPGDRLTLVYGQDGMPAPVISQEYEFTVGVDPDGTRSAPYSGFSLVPGPRALRVKPARAASLRCIAPSILAQAAHVRAADKDRHGNLSPGRSKLRCSRRKVNPGAYRYLCVSGRRRVLSNVSLRESPWQGHRLFWGEIHGHTRRSDGLGTPEEYYRYGRDHALLDFCAIADHSCYMSREDWKEEKEAAHAFLRPHDFVTLNGYELNYNTEWRPLHGDKNAYFPSDDPPLVYDSDSTCLNHRDFTDVARELKAHGAMMVTHAHAGGLSSFHDEDLVRLTEVHSALHGNFESQDTAHRYFPQSARPSTRYFLGRSGAKIDIEMAQDVLARGWRLGLIAGSDCHVGHPGGNHGGRSRVGRNGSSLTAVYAPELTREAVWDALWNRRCYATTGERMIVYLEINGHAMGDEFSFEGRTPKLCLHYTAAGTCDLQRVDIVRNNRTIHSVNEPGLVAEGQFDETVPFDETMGPLAWYYLRVVQKDGHLAWSTPVWVKAR